MTTPQDPTFYQVLETGPASWGLQYGTGEFFGGFATRALAMEQAQALIAQPVDNFSDSITGAPRSMQEAADLAQNARDRYLTFITNYPQSSTADRAPYVAAIARNDSYVSSFAGQQGLARTQVSATDTLSDIQANQRLNIADMQRKTLMQQAVDLRSSGNSLQIANADRLAFEAERYYQNLIDQQSAGTLAVTQSYVTTADPTGVSSTSGIPNSQLVQRDVPDPVATGSIVDIRAATANSAAGSAGGVISPGNMLVDYNSMAANVSASVNNSATNLNSALAGITNNIDSTFASIGGTSMLGNTSTATASSAGSERRVRISAKSALSGTLFTGLLEPLATTKGMVFPYTPTITNQASANYNTITTVHANQDWHIYQNTPSVQLVINGVFTAQNETEAKYLLASMHFLRAVTKMHFGDSDNNKGLPPPQMLLDGYGTYMYNQLSVIINSYNVDLPNNVDYVDVNLGGAVSQVPSITNITVTCTVQNTPKKSREFNWDKFASGELMKSGRWI